jgi:hypothetical protein
MRFKGRASSRGPGQGCSVLKTTLRSTVKSISPLPGACSSVAVVGSRQFTCFMSAHGSSTACI